MAVYRRLKIDQRPAWSDVTSAGSARISAGESFDPHYHDCDEYWLIYGGHALVSVDGERYTVGAGDIVCTQSGRVHDILAVDGTLEMFWFEGVLAPGGRAGHLHSTPQDAAGHPIATLPPPVEG
ncbi:MAG: cupin domain-containing protein [Chloroflexota bacterium]|nr:cupin domain-containing protein [Chloroflexota bacterium]